MRFPWWLLIPLLTCGAGSGPVVVYGGARRRSAAHIAAGIGYAALFTTFFVAVQFSQPDTTGPVDAVAILALLASWLGGTTHAAVLHRSMLAPSVADPRDVADALVRAAHMRIQRRAEARALVAENPALGAELLIGRPDLGRRYDDGGLVDVNHVPAAVLVRELELAPTVADQIIQARERHHGFGSPDELLIHCEGLSPDRLATIRDRLLFLPR